MAWLFSPKVKQIQGEAVQSWIGDFRVSQGTQLPPLRSVSSQGLPFLNSSKWLTDLQPFCLCTRQKTGGGGSAPFLLMGLKSHPLLLSYIFMNQILLK